MDKEEYLKECKYFHGEDEFPRSRLKDAELGFLVWEAEMSGYNSIIAGEEEELIGFWQYAGLPGCSSDLHPLILASLFAIYSKYADLDTDLDELAKNFNDIFLPRYMALTVK